MTPTFHNFPNCLTYQRMFWYQNPSKKVSLRSGGIFPRKTQFIFSANKLKNMAILRLSWRGSTNSKKYILQLICVKKDCFYPIQVLEIKFFNFWHFPEAQKLVEKVAFFLIKPCLDKFSTIAGWCQIKLKHGF